VTALQGSIGTFALPEILLLIARSSASGELRVTRDGAEEVIWFDKGHVRGATGDLADSKDAAPDEEQMRKVVLELLHWDAGSFYFNPGSAPEADFSVSVEGLLIEASAGDRPGAGPKVELSKARGPRRPPRIDPTMSKDLLIRLMSGIEKL
jgi:uncharacterized protein DUF4388